MIKLSPIETLDACRRGQASYWSAIASIAGNSFSVECNEPSFFDGFFIAFGGTVPSQTPADRAASLSATIHVPDGDTAGLLRLFKSGQPEPAEAFFFGLTFEDSPYESRPSGSGWTSVFLRGESEPRFMFRGNDCLFSRADWRTDVLTLLYRGALRLCGDLIFFHASALSVHGRGVMLVGRTKSGKSTTALALVARGHPMLADSCASYKPSTGELLAFRRPVGIREGPKSKAVADALASRSPRSMMADDSVRVEVKSLLPSTGAGAAAVGVDSIFFLRGFAAETQLQRIHGGRSELANLQPIYSSFVDTPHTQRTFELIQLLSRARLYALRPGDPDDAARHIEEAVLS
ncbi:MAG TPA: hypothetical protein VI391_02690 [Thermoanaerobaculia bacterium]